jgi:hypothetical protein
VTNYFFEKKHVIDITSLAYSYDLAIAKNQNHPSLPN